MKLITSCFLLLILKISVMQMTTFRALLKSYCEDVQLLCMFYVRHQCAGCTLLSCNLFPAHSSSPVAQTQWNLLWRSSAGEGECKLVFVLMVCVQLMYSCSLGGKLLWVKPELCYQMQSQPSLKCTLQRTIDCGGLIPSPWLLLSCLFVSQLIGRILEL